MNFNHFLQQHPHSYLLDVVEQNEPGHVKDEREELEWEAQQGRGEAEGLQDLLQEGGITGQLANATPEPDSHRKHRQEVDRLQTQPDLSKDRIGRVLSWKQD